MVRTATLQLVSLTVASYSAGALVALAMTSEHAWFPAACFSLSTVFAFINARRQTR